uniref:Mediator of RNA polymerase II transcription subunit 31 n=1 Tax=Ananas comosus var. bracteatus TaxID=296719 RepID=A0A6V7QL55_ANACO|nr:unnamed protein product [Ananas comosus var. bracteatus]
MVSSKESMDCPVESPPLPNNPYKDPDDGRQRFLLELEFVQCLANPTYIHCFTETEPFPTDSLLSINFLHQKLPLHTIEPSLAAATWLLLLQQLLQKLLLQLSNAAAAAIAPSAAAEAAATAYCSYCYCSLMLQLLLLLQQLEASAQAAAAAVRA